MKHLVCTHRGQWVNNYGDLGTGPAEGEIVKPVAQLIVEADRYLLLAGYERLANDEFAWYHERHFRPTDATFGEWVESTLMREAEYELTLALN